MNARWEETFLAMQAKDGKTSQVWTYSDSMKKRMQNGLYYFSELVQDLKSYIAVNLITTK